MHIYGVSFDIVGKQPIVLLKTAEGNKFLPIWIGHPEAAAILMKLQGASTPRPMTHDLVTSMLGELDAQVVRITVTELRENTFHATITIQQNGTEIEVDSRPSDAIALAVRAEAPIYADDRVIEESAIEFEGEEVNEEEIVDEFRRFLDHVTPDEFAVEETSEEQLGVSRATSRFVRSSTAAKSSRSPSAESGPPFARVRYWSIHSSRSGSRNPIPRESLYALICATSFSRLLTASTIARSVVGDLLAELAEDGVVVVAHGRPCHCTYTRLPVAGIVISR